MNISCALSFIPSALSGKERTDVQKKKKKKTKITVYMKSETRVASHILG